MGLIESVIGREELYRAMDIVNGLIQQHKLKPVLCGWECKVFDETELYYFLTQPDGLPAKTIAQNSKENNSIFVSSSWRIICNETFRLTDEDSILRTNALVFVLLHELGHLIGKNGYEKIQGSQITLDSMLFKNSGPMKEEIFADFFAAEMVKTNTGDAGIALKKSIDTLYDKVDYYYDSRYGIHGGGLRLVLAEPAKRFGDLSYIHPNLNLRMHMISYLIEPTAAKLHRLIWIQEQRKLFYDVNTFTPDVMDGLTYLKNIPDEDTVHLHKNK
ncbi:hypothetical protein [Ferruginibacter sp.]